MPGIVTYAGDSGSDTEEPLEEKDMSSAGKSLIDAELLYPTGSTDDSGLKPDSTSEPSSAYLDRPYHATNQRSSLLSGPPSASTVTPLASPSNLASSSKSKRKHLSGIKLSSRNSAAGVGSPNHAPSRMEELASQPQLAFSPRRAESTSSRNGKGKGRDDGSGPAGSSNDMESSEHQGESNGSAVGEGWERYDPAFAGLDEDEVFKLVTMPKPLAGKVDWGIPSLTDVECDPVLQTKVENFLALKEEKDQHINTTLLSSSAFANPHIYTKLVEFIDIDERGSAFPGGGWLTRRRLDERRVDWGPSVLGGQQKIAQEAAKFAQTPGSRSSIQFQQSSSKNGASSASGSAAGSLYPFILPLNVANAISSSSGSHKSKAERQHELRQKLSRGADLSSGQSGVSGTSSRQGGHPYKDKDGHGRKEKDRDRDRDRERERERTSDRSSKSRWDQR